MKRNIVLLYIVLLTACNSTSTGETNNDTDTGSINAEVATAPATEQPVAGCDKLLFFKKGVEIESTTYNGSETVLQKEVSKVTDVKNENGMMVAVIESTDITGGKTPGEPLTYNIKCDGKTFYVDIAPLMGAAMEGGNAKMDVSALAFPVSIKDGQSLPDAAVTVDMALGEKSVTTKVTYKNRKVEGVQPITTAAGTWTCYKVVASIEMEMTGLDAQTKKMMGAMKENAPSSVSIMYYAPETGIVQFDMLTDGELRSSSRITAIRQPGEAKNNNNSVREKLKGNTFTELRRVPGLEGFEFREGHVVSDLNGPGLLIADVFQKGSDWIAFFTYKKDKDRESYFIADVLEVKDVEKGWQLSAGLCRQNEKDDMDIVALVKTEVEAEFMKQVKKAWRFNRNKKAFEEINIAGVDCRSEG